MFLLKRLIRLLGVPGLWVCDLESKGEGRQTEADD